MEIYAPPNPRESASPRHLHEDLLQLKNWIADHTPWANDWIEANGPRDDDGNPTEETQPLYDVLKVRMASKDAFVANSSISGLYSTWLALRKIREGYDYLVREYESSEELWDSDECISRRLPLIDLSIQVFVMAFMTNEAREAYIAKRKSAIQVRELDRESDADLLKRLLSQGNTEGVETISDEDMDRLFNPPPEDLEE